MNKKTSKLIVGGVIATMLGAGGVGVALAAPQHMEDASSTPVSSASPTDSDLQYGGNEMPTPHEIISSCLAAVETDDVYEVCSLINAMPELAYNLDELEAEMNIDYDSLGPEDVGKEIAPGLIYGGV